MSEVLEGVLSEALLDQLASDLGVEPIDLRKHPFFRVLKGRVLLTYPLRVSRDVWTAKEPAYLVQLNPVATQYYEVLAETEDVKLHYIVVYHNEGANEEIWVKITIDDVVYESGTSLTTALKWCVVIDTHVSVKTLEFLDSATDKYLVNRYESLEGKVVKVEMKSQSGLTAGKQIMGAAYYSVKE